MSTVYISNIWPAASKPQKIAKAIMHIATQSPPSEPSRFNQPALLWHVACACLVFEVHYELSGPRSPSPLSDTNATVTPVHFIYFGCCILYKSPIHVFEASTLECVLDDMVLKYPQQ